MTKMKMKTVEIDLNSEFFEKHVQFLTKITVKEVSEGKFELTYPCRFKDAAKVWRHFEFLCWFWYMQSAMDKYMKEQQKGDVPSYAR
jgi:hypothetical protein